MRPHPYADLFPMMDKKALQGLVASIRDDGLEQPIVTFEGQILDGRNRALACANAKIKPTYVKYKGDDPLGYVMRVNMNRRHLTAAQRGMVASKIANLTQGGCRVKKSTAPIVPLVTTKQAAELLGVGLNTVKRAKELRKTGDETLIKAVERGEIKLTPALKAAKPVSLPTTPIEEIQSGKLLRVWDKTGPPGRTLFVQGIGATV